MKYSSVLGIVFLATSLAAQGDMSFSNQAITLPAPIRDIAVADVLANPGDERLVASLLTSDIAIYDAASTLLLSVPTATSPMTLAVVDLDADGDRDIVVACGSIFNATPFAASVLTNQGGSFSRVDLPLTGGGNVFIARINGDAAPDVVIGRDILLNDGLGALSVAASIGDFPDATAFVPGDFDGDADTDLAAGFIASGLPTDNGYVVGILRQNASAAFVAGTATLIDATAVDGELAAADMNGDGIVDLVAVSTDAVTTSARTLLADANAGWTATAAIRINASGQRMSPTIGDFSGDGTPDLLFNASLVLPSHGTSCFTDAAIFLTNDGQGRLRRATGPLIADLVVATSLRAPFRPVDLDGDGDLDILCRSSTGAATGYALINDGIPGPGTAPFIGTPSITDLSQVGPTFTLTVPVLLPGNLPAFGHLVRFSIIPGSIAPTLISSADTSVSNCFGNAGILVTGLGPGTFTIVATLQNGSSFTFGVPVPPIKIDSGDDQATAAGTSFSAPLTVRLSDPADNPIVGAVVQFAPLTVNTVSLTSPGTVMTDADGRASVTAQATINGGVCRVNATYAGSTVTFDLFARRLRLTNVNATLRVLTYAHEHPSVPLLLAIDLPLPAPGYLPSIYGDLATTVANPGPNLVVLDGIGAFGPPDPTLVTNPAGAWNRTYQAPNPPLGITFSLQLHGYDVAYPFPQVVTSSNPLMVNL